MVKVQIAFIALSSVAGTPPHLTRLMACMCSTVPIIVYNAYPKKLLMGVCEFQLLNTSSLPVVFAARLINTIVKLNIDR